jgi:hypothetical protein
MTINFSQKTILRWEDEKLDPLKKFFLYQQLPVSDWPILELTGPNGLPKPYDFLLTQDIMTLGISRHYLRSPRIRAPIFKTIENNIYSRAVIMIIDNNADRDDPDAADSLQQTTAVELGLININLNALPQQITTALENTSMPFGTLLKKHELKTISANRQLFKIRSIPLFQKYLNFSSNELLYGRTNTLIDEQNHWLANVVEILA